MLRHLVWMLLLATITLHKAQAIVFVEPMVGYGTGSLTFDFHDITDPTISASDEFDLKGLGYGVRGGFEFGNWQLGAEYMAHQLKASGGNGTLILDDDTFKSKEYTALIGYRFYFFRLYGGYIFKADVEDSDMMSGNGFKTGLSFYALRNMALNLEYRLVTLDEVATKLEYSQLAFMLSFPFSI